MATPAATTTPQERQERELLRALTRVYGMGETQVLLALAPREPGTPWKEARETARSSVQQLVKEGYLTCSAGTYPLYWITDKGRQRAAEPLYR